MNYDLFVSDFDGTLVKADGTISAHTKEVIAAYREQGGIFTICTGRMVPSILPRARELGITSGPVIAFQGSVIYDMGKEEVIRAGCFPREAALSLIRLLEEAGLHIHIYTVWDLFTNRRDEMLESYERVCGVRGTVIGGSLADYAAQEGLDIVKVLVMVEPEKREALRERLSQSLGEEYYVTSSSDWLVEVMPAGENKGRAVTYLSEYHHIPAARIAAAGDQLNDLPMLEAAGGKFAVRNGVEALKRVAFVIPSNEEDGVAFALERYVMKGDAEAPEGGQQ